MAKVPPCKAVIILSRPSFFFGELAQARNMPQQWQSQLLNLRNHQGTSPVSSMVGCPYIGIDIKRIFMFNVIDCVCPRPGVWISINNIEWINSSVKEKDKNHISLNVEPKRWYKWTRLQTRNRFTDIENRLLVAKGEVGGGEMDWEFGISRCKQLYIK